MARPTFQAAGLRQRICIHTWAQTCYSPELHMSQTPQARALLLSSSNILLIKISTLSGSGGSYANNPSTWQTEDKDHLCQASRGYTVSLGQPMLE